jgi:polysaccharide export outer membrane protein
MSVRLILMSASALSLLLGACARDRELVAVADMPGTNLSSDSVKDGAPSSADGYPVPLTHAAADGPGQPALAAERVAWGEPTVLPSEVIGPHAVADSDGPYLLDTGDRLRIFVYGQPNLSRLYIVDHEGKIAVPLIGNVLARGKTTNQLQAAIRARLGTEYVKDAQVTVDIQQNRPFFILGEVKSAGQFPYVSGMTVETAVAIAGGYTERADEGKFRITRRVNGFVEQVEAPADYVLKPGDTVYVFERFF